MPKMRNGGITITAPPCKVDELKNSGWVLVEPAPPPPEPSGKKEKEKVKAPC